jgi:hypothetical protein
VWAWEHGWAKVPRYIDHINGDRMDNRLENLRPATLSLNAHNARRTKPRREDLPQGVCRHKKSAVNPFSAGISHVNRTIHLGVFATVEEAQSAYLRAKRLVVDHEIAVSLGKVVPEVKLPITRGVKGRPKRQEVEIAKGMYLSGMTANKIAESLGCCDDTARRLLRDSGIKLKRGRPPVDRRPPASMMDARSVLLKEQTDDYGNSYGERGQAARTQDVEVGQANGELLHRLDGEEGRPDDVGGRGVL